MKFKVGDKVRVREDLKVGETYGCNIFTSGMLPFCGKVVTIKEKNKFADEYRIEELHCYWFSSSMLTPPKVERWKPKKDKHYWFVNSNGTVYKAKWDISQIDMAWYKFGNCFRTRKLARAARERVRWALKGE